MSSGQVLDPEMIIMGLRNRERDAHVVALNLNRFIPDVGLGHF